MKTHRRGQAALEFLTTYGWAFLVILVMIGALAYFGVIDPNRFLPEKCLFQQEFHCKDYQVKLLDATHANVSFYITNNLGTGVIFAANSVTVNQTGYNGAGFDQCPETAVNLGAGMTAEIQCSGGSGVPGRYIAGEKAKMSISATYTTTTGLYARTMNGDIFAIAQ